MLCERYIADCALNLPLTLTLLLTVSAVRAVHRELYRQLTPNLTVALTVSVVRAVHRLLRPQLTPNPNPTPNQNSYAVDRDESSYQDSYAVDGSEWA